MRLIRTLRGDLETIPTMGLKETRAPFSFSISPFTKLSRSAHVKARYSWTVSGRVSGSEYSKIEIVRPSAPG